MDLTLIEDRRLKLVNNNNNYRSSNSNNDEDANNEDNNNNSNNIYYQQTTPSKAAATAAVPTTSRLMPTKLTNIGLYTICATLGQGNFSKVYLAKHRTTDHLVAIKLVKSAKLSLDCREKMRREIEIMKKLDKFEHIISLYQIITTKQSYLVLVMEYCENGDLYEFLVKNGPLNEHLAYYYFEQILKAVNFLHKRHIVHRDLKAENILLTNNCKTIKLCDFGFANYFDSSKYLNTWCGSPPYAAPELFKRQAYVGPSVDYWSLGVILYVLTCRAFPFDGADIGELRAKVLRGFFRIPFLMSTECESLIKGLLRLDASKRLNGKQVVAHVWMTKHARIEAERALIVDAATAAAAAAAAAAANCGVGSASNAHCSTTRNAEAARHCAQQSAIDSTATAASATAAAELMPSAIYSNASRGFNSSSARHQASAVNNKLLVAQATIATDTGDDFADINNTTTHHQHLADSTRGKSLDLDTSVDTQVPRRIGGLARSSALTHGDGSTAAAASATPDTDNPSLMLSLKNMFAQIIIDKKQLLASLLSPPAPTMDVANCPTVGPQANLTNTATATADQQKQARFASFSYLKNTPASKNLVRFYNKTIKQQQRHNLPLTQLQRQTDIVTAVSNLSLESADNQQQQQLLFDATTTTTKQDAANITSDCMQTSKQCQPQPLKDNCKQEQQLEQPKTNWLWLNHQTTLTSKPTNAPTSVAFHSHPNKRQIIKESSIDEHIVDYMVEQLRLTSEPEIVRQSIEESKFDELHAIYRMLKDKPQLMRLSSSFATDESLEFKLPSLPLLPRASKLLQDQQRRLSITSGIVSSTSSCRGDASEYESDEELPRKLRANSSQVEQMPLDLQIKQQQQQRQRRKSALGNASLETQTATITTNTTNTITANSSAATSVVASTLTTTTAAAIKAMPQFYLTPPINEAGQLATDVGRRGRSYDAAAHSQTVNRLSSTYSDDATNVARQRHSFDSALQPSTSSSSNSNTNQLTSDRVAEQHAALSNHFTQTTLLSQHAQLSTATDSSQQIQLWDSAVLDSLGMPSPKSPTMLASVDSGVSCGKKLSCGSTKTDTSLLQQLTLQLEETTHNQRTTNTFNISNQYNNEQNFVSKQSNASNNNSSNIVSPSLTMTHNSPLVANRLQQAIRHASGINFAPSNACKTQQVYDFQYNEQQFCLNQRLLQHHLNNNQQHQSQQQVLPATNSQDNYWQNALFYYNNNRQQTTATLINQQHSVIGLQATQVSANVDCVHSFAGNQQDEVTAKCEQAPLHTHLLDANAQSGSTGLERRASDSQTNYATSSRPLDLSTNNNK